MKCQFCEEEAAQYAYIDGKYMLVCDEHAVGTERVNATEEREREQYDEPE